VILRPSAEDHRVVARYTGQVVVGFGLLMLIPIATSVVFAEWGTASDFTVGLLASLCVGLGLQVAAGHANGLRRRHAFVIVPLSWLCATTLGAIPYALSGHFGSFIDCLFDVMSGLTTTGLYLLQDLDHVSNGLNMWRFVLTFVGGQGIVVLALTFLFRGTGGTFHLYAGEGKEEKLLPNVIGTARMIWMVSLVWLIAGTTILTAGAWLLGQSPTRAVLHGLWVFMGAFSTGGFAPQSYNTFWYHSFAFEIVTMLVFFAGSLNFALHWTVWRGRRDEILRNIETRSFVLTLTLFIALASFGLARAGVYPDQVTLFRKVFYQLLSGHTTTGFGTVASRALVTQWGPVAMLAIIGAMIIGASSCSTAGGIKGLRVGVISKAFLQSIRRSLSPDSAVVSIRYHHGRDVLLTDEVTRTALMIALTFLAMHAIVTVAGVLSGYPLLEAMFDGISAASNTGLSCGVISPAMPVGLKITLTLAMWLGRLEFFSVFAFIAWIGSVVRA
jgi:trk system potassium uptake protein TrkH